jgi:hypothetical protein
MKEIIGEDNFMKLLANMKEGDYKKEDSDTVTFFIKNSIIKDAELDKIEKKISEACMIKDKDISLIFTACDIMNVQILNSCLDTLHFEKCNISNLKCDHLVLNGCHIVNPQMYKMYQVFKFTLSKSSIEYLSLNGSDMDYMQESLFENNKIDQLYVDTLDMRCNMAKNNKIRYISKIANVRRGW